MAKDLRKSARLLPYIWHVPDEEPGTLEEIFAVEDNRANNLVLYEIRGPDGLGFRRCWEVIGAPGDPYDLIKAVTSCINLHLNPIGRLADQRRRMRLVAERGASAVAPQEFLCSLDELEQRAWLWRLKDLGLSYPHDPGITADLCNMAAGLNGMLARGAFKDVGGRPRMVPFERLVKELGRVFENATGRRPPALTWDPYSDPPAYRGPLLDFVRIVGPIVTSIIARSGGRLAEPNDLPEFIRTTFNPDRRRRGKRCTDSTGPR